IGRAATNVAVALNGELERVGPPVVAVSGLDVEVVVDGDRRPAGRLGEPGVDQRMAAGFDQRCARAYLLEQRTSCVGAASDVSRPGWIDRDGRDVDKLGQPTLEIGTVTGGERLIVRARGRGDGHRTKGNGHGASVRLGAQAL